MQKTTNISTLSSTEIAYKRRQQVRSGTRIDLPPRDVALREPISLEKLRTLQDLLDAIAKLESDQPHLLAMLRSTGGHISDYLERPLHQVEIGQIRDVVPELKQYLKERRYKRNSIRSYLNYTRILLQEAEGLGWKEGDAEVEAAWQLILAAVSKKTGCASIVKYVILNRIKPTDFSDADLDGWEAWMLRHGKACSYVRGVKGTFRSLIFRSGFRTALTDQSVPGGRIYAIHFDHLPEPLRSQVDKLVEWKVAEYSPGRPKRGRHRIVTAKQLRYLICRIFGFLQSVQGKPISRLEELVTKDSLSDFVAWMINKRKVKSAYLSVWLRMLLSAVKRYPPLSGHNFEWVAEFISEIPTEHIDSLRQEAKDRKWVDYDGLAQIPNKIREERARVERRKTKRLASMVRNELLVKWLTVLPWRQRNLRECKLASKAAGGNLFKEELSSGTIAKPEWVEEALKAKPHEKFWQFYFRPEETKTGHSVHATLPKQLVPILEEYLQFHRSVLVGASDPGVLFVSAFRSTTQSRWNP